MLLLERGLKWSGPRLDKIAEVSAFETFVAERSSMSADTQSKRVPISVDSSHSETRRSCVLPLVLAMKCGCQLSGCSRCETDGSSPLIFRSLRLCSSAGVDSVHHPVAWIGLSRVASHPPRPLSRSDPSMALSRAQTDKESADWILSTARDACGHAFGLGGRWWRLGAQHGHVLAHSQPAS
jgi:hypothetical protein